MEGINAVVSVIGPTEKQVAYQVRRLYEAVGCTVYSTSQARPSRVAKGLPDLLVAHPKTGLFVHEVKTPKGRQSPQQVAFQQTMQRCGVSYVLGGVEEATAFVERKGVLVAGIVKFRSSTAVLPSRKG